MATEHKDVSVFSAVAFLLAGPLIWAGHLLLVYGPQSALCAFGTTGMLEVDKSLISAVVLIVTAAAAIPLLIILLRPAATARLLRFNPEGGDHTFSTRVTRLLTALSLIAVLLAGAAALLLDPCAQLR